MRTRSCCPREFVSRYEIDGAWFDMAKPIGPECFCAECRRQILAASQDPQDAAAQRAHKHGLFVDLHRRLTTLVKQARPGCQARRLPGDGCRRVASGV